MMDGAAQWLILGLTIGFAVHWLYDWFTWRKWALNQPGREELDDSVRKISELEARLAESLAEFESQLKSAAATARATPVPGPEVDLGSSAVVSAKSQGMGLNSIDGLNDDHRQALDAAGIRTPEDLVAAGEEKILEVIGAQPWDAVDVANWILQAQANAGATSGESPIQSQAGDDFMKLEGMTEEYATKLSGAGISTFGDLAALSEDRVLEIIEAQPWDMVDVATWVAQSKERANG
ncbi:helix-hairpin-helix domain-containing protein [Kamptonema cortianum]|nr:helix-hairpin-helix domain-containing protein [Kamptonema cortianum]